MAETSGQNKAVKNFVGAEIFMDAVEYREFAGIKNASDGVDDSPGKKPKKGCFVQQSHNVGKGEHTQPSHDDV